MITLDLTKKEEGFLVAAVSELYHKIRAAEEQEFVVADIGNRIATAKSLWHKVKEQVDDPDL